MSTPPFVDLPEGVTPTRWPVGAGHRAVLHAGPGGGVDDWVLLVPGFTGSKEDFIAVLPLLAAVGIGAVTFDQCGQYESTGSSDPGSYALTALAADLAAVTETVVSTLGWTSPPHLLGHSFGGLVAQQAVIDDAVRPRTLTLLDTGPGALPPSAHADLERLREAVTVVGLELIWPQLPAAARPMSPAVAAFVERRWCANDPEHVREVARILMTTPDLTRALRDAVGGKPVVVAWGESDETWPSAGQRPWAGELGATAVELPGSGHSPNVDDPEGLVDALRAAWGC